MKFKLYIFCFALFCLGSVNSSVASESTHNKDLAPTIHKPVQRTETAKTRQQSASQLLAQYLQNIKTFKAQFTQASDFSEATLPDAKNATKKKISGLVSWKKPNHFLWHTKVPYEQIIIIKDGVVWNIDPTLEQVIIQEQSITGLGAPVLLLNQETDKVLKKFDITMHQQSKTKTVFTLKPNSQENSIFKKLKIIFVNKKPTAFIINDNFGQHQKILLTNIAINKKIADKQFKVDFPKSYTVIDQTANSKQ